jgi:hypothetical protein
MSETMRGSWNPARVCDPDRQFVKMAEDQRIGAALAHSLVCVRRWRVAGS